MYYYFIHLSGKQDGAGCSKDTAEEKTPTVNGVPETNGETNKAKESVSVLWLCDVFDFFFPFFSYNYFTSELCHLIKTLINYFKFIFI